jgi:tRNA pseudouridine65 synthase
MPPPRSPPPDPPAPLRVLFEDADLVVVAKPAGLLVHPTDQAPDRVTVLQLARDATGGAHLHPVHRLDRGASGVLLLARSPAAAANLQAQLEQGTADKRYLAAVRGAPPEAGPIRRREDGPRVPARSEYRRLAVVPVPLQPGEPPRESRYALVEARPLTGRLHQVRLHLKHIGHPILGDVNHGRSEHNRLCRERFGLLRLALHAARLTIDHPTTGARLTFEAPLPDDLRVPLTRMGFAV